MGQLVPWPGSNPVRNRVVDGFRVLGHGCFYPGCLFDWLKLKEVSQICKMSCPKLWGAARQGLPSHGGKMQLFYTILIRQPSPPSLNTLQSRYFEMQFLANSPCMNLGARVQTSYWHIGGDISCDRELPAVCLLKGKPVRIDNFPA